MEAQDKFLIKLSTDKEDLEFVIAMCIEEQWSSVGAPMITQIGRVVQPGFFIGYLNGQRIGCVCACKFGEDKDGFAYIGFYVIDKAFRGKGYGLKLWNVMWESLSKEWNIALDAVLSMVPRYKKMGFNQEWLNKEYIISCFKVVQALQVKSYNEIDIQPIDRFEFDKLSEYDASIFGYPRHAFLKKWITIPESTGIVATNKDGDIIGYAVMHSIIFDADQLVGPLFSDNDDVTRMLLSMLAKAAIERGVRNLRLPVPVGANPSAAQLIEKEIGYDSYWEFIRMYTKGVPPQLRMKNIVAITSAAFE